jgi:hypothetical protein
LFGSQIETAKQVPVKDVPESMWVATDSTEIPKAALTHSLQAVSCLLRSLAQYLSPCSTMLLCSLQSLKELEDFLEYIVITDMNKQLIMYVPPWVIVDLLVAATGAISKANRGLLPACC